MNCTIATIGVLAAGSELVMENVADFDWNSHLEALKKLASSPGVMLYAGRRMFPVTGDKDEERVQQRNLSPHVDITVMESVCYLYYFSPVLPAIIEPTAIDKPARLEHSKECHAYIILSDQNLIHACTWWCSYCEA
jgi:hypothetical protein